LGYPTHDPHGDPIPRADGQLAAVEAIALPRQPIGSPAIIKHLEDEPPELFRQILAAGLAPGMRIEIVDLSPTQLVIWNGDREHSLSPLAASNVFVAPLPAPAAPAVRLSALEPGGQARVVALRSHGLTRRRLLDLGVTPGAIVERVFTSPFGEPTAYRIRGALIALRREQTAEIEIEPLDRQAA
jgi:DtxR family Mn-dependent transcriptional regulator